MQTQPDLKPHEETPSAEGPGQAGARGSSPPRRSPYMVRRSTVCRSTGASQPGSAPTVAQRCGAWLFRHRTYTLAPLAGSLVAAALYVSAAPLVVSPFAVLLPFVGICALLAAEAIRLHVAGRARRGTSSRGVTFEAGTLITTGTYGLVRNPLYLANVLIWCGMAMLTGSPAVLAVAAVVTVVQYHLIILAEEDYLAGRYGHRYEEYCRSVPRWIPRVVLGRGRTEPGPSPAPFTWSRALFREADTLLLLALGAWFLSGLSRAWMPWHRGADVPGVWYLVPVGSAVIWLAVKWLKKSRWRSRDAAP